MRRVPVENERIVKPYIKLRSRFLSVTFMFLLIFLALSGVFIGVLYRRNLFMPIFSNPMFVVLLVFIISFAIASLLAFYVDRKILSPVEKLSEASKKVAKGDFSVRLPVDRTSEETFTTFSNFNEMVEGLSAIETLRDDFVANVSHEFKTPLAAIEGYAALLQEETLSEKDRREYASKILFNTRRLSDLTSNILMLSKLENRKTPPEKTTFRLDEQLREAILMLEPKWSAKNVNFDLENLPEITYNGAEPLLLQVWTNIIGNAVKFVSEGGNISVSAEETLNFVTVKITDDGIGMSEETKYRIFDKFYQGDTSHRSGGNGLGLTLCLTIVSLCGGSIAVDSKEKQGSTFTVKLPK